MVDETIATPAYIGFEGPIGAGKTTLATLLARQIGADLLLENFGANEFLEDFYKEQARWALPMQLAFLAERHEQLASVPAARTRYIVADHSYAKDRMFAGILLRERELRLYETLSRSLSNTVTSPDLVVYLDAPNSVLLDRIRARARPYEHVIDAAYLERLRAGYQRDILSDESQPVLIVDSSSVNLSLQPQLDHLFDRILRAAARARIAAV